MLQMLSEMNSKYSGTHYLLKNMKHSVSFLKRVTNSTTQSPPGMVEVVLFITVSLPVPLEEKHEK